MRPQPALCASANLLIVDCYVSMPLNLQGRDKTPQAPGRVSKYPGLRGVDRTQAGVSCDGKHECDIEAAGAYENRSAAAGPPCNRNCVGLACSHIHVGVESRRRPEHDRKALRLPESEQWCNAVVLGLVEQGFVTREIFRDPVQRPLPAMKSWKSDEIGFGHRVAP